MNKDQHKYSESSSKVEDRFYFWVPLPESFELGPSPRDRLVRFRNFKVRETLRFRGWEQTHIQTQLKTKKRDTSLRLYHS